MKKFSGFAALLMSASVVAVSAQAQTAPSGASTTTAAPSNQIEDVVVTAERRSESLQQVPIAVSVISGEELSDRNLHGLTDLQFMAPSVQYNAFTGGGFQIRGVGTQTVNLTSEQDVGIVIDDVVQGIEETDFAAPSYQALTDIDHIEVLKGPQGTLFGKNSSVGVLQIITKKPILNTLRGRRQHLLRLGQRGVGAGEHQYSGVQGCRVADLRLGRAPRRLYRQRLYRSEAERVRPVRHPRQIPVAAARRSLRLSHRRRFAHHRQRQRHADASKLRQRLRGFLALRDGRGLWRHGQPHQHQSGARWPDGLRDVDGLELSACRLRRRRRQYADLRHGLYSQDADRRRRSRRVAAACPQHRHHAGAFRRIHAGTAAQLSVGPVPRIHGGRVLLPGEQHRSQRARRHVQLPAEQFADPSVERFRRSFRHRRSDAHRHAHDELCGLRPGDGAHHRQVFADGRPSPHA